MLKEHPLNNFFARRSRLISSMSATALAALLVIPSPLLAACSADASNASRVSNTAVSSSSANGNTNDTSDVVSAKPSGKSASELGVTTRIGDTAYVDSLFSTDKVHTIDVSVDEESWLSMLANATEEKYILADVTIDGITVSEIGIRPKGNSSLATIAASDSDRYSFKIEFDHYVDDSNYLGLDKLALNNIAQDNTYMKDYISYQLMNEMGAYAPLSSFIWITINGEDWGLYLAAEAIEDSWIERTQSTDEQAAEDSEAAEDADDTSANGNLYKPDTMDMNAAGGMGAGANGQGGFPGGGQMPDDAQVPGDFGNMQPPEGMELPEGFDGGMGGGGRGAMGNFGDAGGMGSNSAVALVYTDDDPESYAAIFDNAATKISEDDKERLIASLKQLNEGKNIDEVVNTDEVLRYFVVHNFVLNSDSYTGSMSHNYYLYEQDGQLSMVAWDYNLAFGGMGNMGGGFGGGAANSTSATDNATSLVNYPIDSPMLSGSVDDKPMIAWIFANEEYLDQYHALYAELVDYFASDGFAKLYDDTIALIAPYVAKDPSAFCTYEEFQTAQETLREFCLLRAQSIGKQLDGTIASTSDGQSDSNQAGFVDASAIDVQSMGSNSMGFGRARQ